MPQIRSLVVIATTLILGLSACRPKQEPVEPEDDTWVPDESLEPPAAAVQSPDPAPGLSEEERNDKAKELYIAAEGKAAADDWGAALSLYEEAYHLVPGKHGFALKVGYAAEKVGDCDKAISYLEHFVTYAEADKYEDDLGEARRHLDALRKDCS